RRRHDRPPRPAPREPAGPRSPHRPRAVTRPRSNSTVRVTAERFRVLSIRAPGVRRPPDGRGASWRSAHEGGSAMANYLLLYHGGGRPESETEQAKVMAAWGEWMGKVGAALGDGGKPTRHAENGDGDGT